ncbi:MAG TPA: adenine phosphoribosyltransferase [Polyangiales bacterium]|jgi:adenine phosphoribosyltransferase|nr:adenine phosphoribosyltransferase [Polyangiales bacterium]
MSDAVRDVLERCIRDVPDFPKPGILFKDITPILSDPRAFNLCLDAMAEPYDGKPLDVIVGIEARGFIFGAALASRLRKAFVPARKPGKLPAAKHRVEYQLEYGTDAIEIHTDAIQPGQQVLIVDDVLATGGTASATCQLVQKLGGQVIGASFVIELTFLPGRERMRPIAVSSLVQY